VDKANPTAEAVAVSESALWPSVRTPDVTVWRGSQTRVVDAGVAIMVPI